MNNIICFLSEISASTPQSGLSDMIIRTAIFLSLLALGGYFFVLFFRRGYFYNYKSQAVKSQHEEIKVVSMRILSGKKYLVVVEHSGRRFLLALTNDNVEKLSEWEISNNQ